MVKVLESVVEVPVPGEMMFVDKPWVHMVFLEIVESLVVVKLMGFEVMAAVEAVMFEFMVPKVMMAVITVIAIITDRRWISFIPPSMDKLTRLNAWHISSRSYKRKGGG